MAPLLAAPVVVGSAVIAAAATLAALRYARHRGLIDQPGERRSHETPTPRGGGIGIVLAMAVALSWIGWWPVLAGLLLVATAGWVDDHRPLPAWPRLLAHALAAALLAFSLRDGGAAWPVAIAAFVLALVLVNVWNFMDGIDGLAASQALLASLALVLCGVAWWLALALGGACLGFLPFNFPKARIFLGDVGSGALGYLVAVPISFGLATQPPLAWPWLLLPVMAMLTDAGLTLASRMLRGERWWQPHVQHAYQRWSRRRSHVVVTLAYSIWTVAALAVMLSTQRMSADMRFAIAVACFLATALAWFCLRRRGAGAEGIGT